MDDPIRLLADNLDFWPPATTEVMQDILRTFPVVSDPIEPGAVHLEVGSIVEGAAWTSTRVGSDPWKKPTPPMLRR